MKFSAAQAKTCEGHCRSVAAFTLVEIAISLAVIAFALVAIIGVLPTGMQVQKDNREETIINQEATYLANAIRSGARGLDDLTNAIGVIEIHWTEFKVINVMSNVPTGAKGMDRYTYSNSAVTRFPVPATFGIYSGANIIGLLSTPKYDPPNFLAAGGFYSNHVVAYVRAFSGLASEKSPQDNADVRQDAFSYRLICENQLLPIPSYALTSNFETNLANNLRELRLTFRWPLLVNGNVGNGRQVFRLQVGGSLLATNDSNQPLYFFRPEIFAKGL